MRLYLNAESKNNIGYTPDWIQVYFEEKEFVYNLTLDIQGEIDYDPTCLCCRCKGDLIPWVLRNCDTDEETDFSELSYEEIISIFPMKRIVEIFTNGFDHLVGIYPVNDQSCADDVLSNGNGTIELYVSEEDECYSIDFKFETEINL